jgi:hypothetical protein
VREDALGHRRIQDRGEDLHVTGKLPAVSDG